MLIGWSLSPRLRLGLCRQRRPGASLGRGLGRGLLLLCLRQGVGHVRLGRLERGLRTLLGLLPGVQLTLALSLQPRTSVDGQRRGRGETGCVVCVVCGTGGRGGVRATPGIAGRSGRAERTSGCRGRAGGAGVCLGRCHDVRRRVLGRSHRRRQPLLRRIPRLRLRDGHLGQCRGQARALACGHLSGHRDLLDVRLLHTGEGGRG